MYTHRDSHTHTDTDADTHIGTHAVCMNTPHYTHTHIHTHTDTDADTHIGTHAVCMNTPHDTHTHIHTHTDTDADTHIGTHAVCMNTPHYTHTHIYTHTRHRQLTHHWLLWRQASQSILKTVAQPLLYCVGSRFLVLAFLNRLWQGPCKRVHAPVCSISLLMLLTPCSFSHSLLAHSVTRLHGG